MYDTYSTTFKYGNYNTYGELCLDDVNVWDFEFPLTADELEDAVNEQIGQAELQMEAQIADYYTYYGRGGRQLPLPRIRALATVMLRFCYIL